MIVDMPLRRLRPSLSFMRDPDCQRGRMSKPGRQVSKTINLKILLRLETAAEPGEWQQIKDCSSKKQDRSPPRAIHSDPVQQDLGRGRKIHRGPMDLSIASRKFNSPPAHRSRWFIATSFTRTGAGSWSVRPWSLRSL